MSLLNPKTDEPTGDKYSSATAKPAKLGETQPSTLPFVVLIIIATALPFLPALRYGFVFDDDVQVVANVAARASQSPITYFVTSIWDLRDSAVPLYSDYYRPLFHSWLHLNAALFGYKVFGWHLAAIITHLAVTVLVFLLIRHHVRNPWSAMVGALIFGVYPAHIESVVWISGATDPLMTLGVLGSFLLWLKNFEKPAVGLLIGSLACYAAALLSKETAIALPAIVFAYVLFGICRNQDAPGSISCRIKAAIQETLPFIVVTVVYFGVRTAVLHSFRSESQPWISGSQALLTAPSVFVFYLRHLVWPVGLRLFYEFRLVESAQSASFWAPLLVIVAVVVCLLQLWRRRADRTIPAAAAWVAIPLLPVLDIALFHKDDFVHDRYLYLPSIGLAILCSVVANSIIGETPSPRRRLLAIAAVTLLIAALAASTATQSAPWQDNLSLYTHAASNSTNTMARINLASEYAKRGRLEEAKQLLEPVVRERPDFWLANYNLGYVDYRLKNFDSAEQLLDRAIALNPNEADAYMYRGLILFRKGRLEDATALLRHAIALNPRGEGYHFALAIVLMQHNREAAKSEFREELKYHPASGLARMQLDGLERATSNTNPAAAQTLGR